LNVARICASPGAGRTRVSFTFPLIGLVLLSACGGVSNVDDPNSAERAADSGPPVVVAEASLDEVPVEIRAIGAVEAFSSVSVKSQVADQLQSVHFEEGQEVRKDQILFQVDPRPYQQSVREAEATLASAKAALAQSEANYERDLAQAWRRRATPGRRQSATRDWQPKASFRGSKTSSFRPRL
jgi:membrane fusion protein, multidrug efflux system